MKISRIDAFAVRIPRDLARATGTAGSPALLMPAASDYRWSVSYPALYSVNIETALVCVHTDSGLIGWGEAQAPLAPQVACSIIDFLLKPVLLGFEFDATPTGIEAVWNHMYAAMRVRGQTGGFMLDAISGIDLALWDVAGQAQKLPVSQLIAGESAKSRVCSYVSGLNGDSDAARIETAQHFVTEGYRVFKIYCDRALGEIIGTLGSLRKALGSDVSIAVDALWRLIPEDALPFGRMLDERNALWLECPFMPEEINAHVDLAYCIRTPIALGESYRTRYELAPFFEKRAVRVVQPDLGRCGITEGLRIARIAHGLGLTIVPHVSIALGPQIAAAIHFASAVPDCDLLEFNPVVLEAANRFLKRPLVNQNGQYIVPDLPGLGVDFAKAPPGVFLP